MESDLDALPRQGPHLVPVEEFVRRRGRLPGEILEAPGETLGSLPGKLAISALQPRQTREVVWPGEQDPEGRIDLRVPRTGPAPGKGRAAPQAAQRFG
jgi:hypothetical protein